MRKRWLPYTLFGRALLILVLPTILVQLVAIYMFYERHWDSIVRNMSNTLAGQVRLLSEMAQAGKPYREIEEAGEWMGFGIHQDRSRVFSDGIGQAQYPELYALLARKLDVPFSIRQLDAREDIEIAVLTPDTVLVVEVDKKRLVSSTTYIFLLWMVGSALILLTIAVLFLRNQIRPIRNLAEAAEKFGLGHDIPDFRPRGAAEVRQAGRAFMVMRNRIQRQVTTRTQMLAGISHDLRTPLTRMKLQLAMMPEGEAAEALAYDIGVMERMINEYLDFARGASGETAEVEDIDAFIARMVERYQRQEEPVTFEGKSEAQLPIRRNQMARALHNLIDNALRYGGKADITTRRDGKYIVISVSDEGPGVPEEKMEEIFQPFTRLDVSRNQDTGGAGLGLSIARDAVQAHGGTIELRNLKKGGLQVSINLPIELQQVE